MMGGRTSSLMIKAAFPITTVSDSCLAMCLRSLVCILGLQVIEA